MKVLHLINTISAGGAELQLLTLCRYLKQHGVEVVVAYLREQVKGSRSLRPDFKQENIRVINLQADSRYDWRFLGRFVHLLKAERPDISHTHLPRADLAAAFGRLLCPTVAWVSSVHAIYDQCWAGRGTLPLLTFAWRQADTVVAISHAVKKWLVMKRRVPPDQVTVIHYGIEPEPFGRPTADLRETWGLGRSAIVGSVGRLESGKGYDCLIEAMSSILKLAPNTCLLIAGHDPWGYGKHLQALINTLGLHERVRMVGFQSDIVSFLGALDVFAFASHSEGFGQAVIEAMAAGKPVVASKIPPLTEIVVDGETGLLAEPRKPEALAHAITWLLSHPEEAKQMGRQGQQRVQAYFSIERETAQILSLYKALSARCAASAAG
jgi:glycosyltransferase involved in cell wall biosynthesis